eukprot:701726-Pelagomonas_calceolata.AAC.2
MKAAGIVRMRSSRAGDLAKSLLQRRDGECHAFPWDSFKRKGLVYRSRVSTDRLCVSSAYATTVQA